MPTSDVVIGGVLLRDVVWSQRETPSTVGSMKMAVDGTKHRTFTRFDTRWELRVRPVPYSKFQELRNMYRASLGGAVDFSLVDEWPDNTYGAYVSVFITSFPSERLIYPVDDGGTPDFSGRTFSIELEEA